MKNKNIINDKDYKVFRSKINKLSYQIKKYIKNLYNNKLLNIALELEKNKSNKKGYYITRLLTNNSYNKFKLLDTNKNYILNNEDQIKEINEFYINL